MRNPDLIDNFIDRIVAGAHIPSRTSREDLRRELQTHFEDANAANTDPQEAFRRFGAATQIAESFERLYRWDYLCLYFLKLATAIVVSALAAVVIEAGANLRLERGVHSLHLSPGFFYGAGAAISLVLAIAVSWEARRRGPYARTRAYTASAVYLTAGIASEFLVPHSFSVLMNGLVLVALATFCSRRIRSFGKFPTLLGVFAVQIYANHVMSDVTLSPTQALTSGALLVAVWTITLVIFSGFDHVFLTYFEA